MADVTLEDALLTIRDGLRSDGRVWLACGTDEHGNVERVQGPSLRAFIDAAITRPAPSPSDVDIDELINKVDAAASAHYGLAHPNSEAHGKARAQDYAAAVHELRAAIRQKLCVDDDSDAFALLDEHEGNTDAMCGGKEFYRGAETEEAYARTRAAVLARMRGAAVPEWRTIDSAPKDGSIEDAIREYGRICTMIGYATSGLERKSHKEDAEAELAAILARIRDAAVLEQALLQIERVKDDTEDAEAALVEIGCLIVKAMVDTGRSGAAPEVPR